ncbi:MAG: prepilin-type N-terminal cleavage/methylation domain-containing protein [Nitrosomonadales bacterium]|nr:prepilin-type N-terminal cleavage/methylation domain-containing protein [Nitrosomonadales bacterium]
MKRKQSGFTLIEIAIVLVIIGLLLGGVLKGQELINSAKVKNLATDFKNIPVFIYGYQDKFKALPGDDIQAASHVANATSAAQPPGGNGVINGKWDSVTATDETQLFWQHVRLAGLAPGPTTGADLLPTNSINGIIGITNGGTTDNPIAGLRGSYIICSAGILGKYAKQLDTQMDDGNTASGSMMTIPNNAGARPMSVQQTATATGSVDDATSYTVCYGV